MLHKYVFECVHKTLIDLRENDQPFGGMVVILGGDFRQILPVIRHGREADIVESSLKNSFLWTFVRTFHLTINMRARNVSSHSSTSIEDFQSFLLSVGNNTRKKHTHVGSQKYWSLQNCASILKKTVSINWLILYILTFTISSTFKTERFCVLEMKTWMLQMKKSCNVSLITRARHTSAPILFPMAIKLTCTQPSFSTLWHLQVYRHISSVCAK